jgi:dihydrolipoamide dehydrogenase
MRLTCDVAVIGAGTAGLAAERAARSAGAKTLLIDDRFAGTTCTTVGCMPSKLLIATANAAQSVRRASTFGIRTEGPEVDGRAVMERLRKERDTFIAATLKSIEEIPAGVRVRQRARFKDRTSLALDDGDDISAKAIVVATGARPSVPKVFEPLGDLVLTNESVFELTTLPRSIAVVGTGPLGLELAQAFARLDVETEVFEQSDHVAALLDLEVANELKTVLAKEFSMRFGVKLQASRNGRSAKLSWSGCSGGTKSFERVLVAAGRPPDLRYLNLPATGIVLDHNGVPEINESTLQCGEAPIFLAGDADGTRPVLHEASFEGHIAGRNAATYPDIRSVKRTVPLSMMFTDPPLAVIGAPLTDAMVVGTASYADQGRAKVDGCNNGLVRIYAHRNSRKLTGATLFGPAMDHIAHLVAWSIERGSTAGELLRLPIYHPTYEEGLKPALRQICKAIDAEELRHLDEAAPPGA